MGEPGGLPSLGSHRVGHPLFLLPPIAPSIRVFSNESTLRMRWPKYWSFSFSISPSNEHPGLISFRMDWLDLLSVQGTLKSLLQNHSSKASILWCSAFWKTVSGGGQLTPWESFRPVRVTRGVAASQRSCQAVQIGGSEKGQNRVWMGRLGMSRQLPALHGRAWEQEEVRGRFCLWKDRDPDQVRRALTAGV